MSLFISDSEELIEFFDVVAFISEVFTVGIDGLRVETRFEEGLSSVLIVTVLARVLLCQIHVEFTEILLVVRLATQRIHSHSVEINIVGIHTAHRFDRCDNLNISFSPFFFTKQWDDRIALSIRFGFCLEVLIKIVSDRSILQRCPPLVEHSLRFFFSEIIVCQEHSLSEDKFIVGLFLLCQGDELVGFLLVLK